MDQVPEGLVQDLELRCEAAEDRADRAEARAVAVEARAAKAEGAWAGLIAYKDQRIRELGSINTDEAVDRYKELQRIEREMDRLIDSEVVRFRVTYAWGKNIHVQEDAVDMTAEGDTLYLVREVDRG